MKQRNIRKRRALDEQELSEGEAEGADGQPPPLTAEDIKLLQKQRQRCTGVEVSTLMVTDTRVDDKRAGAAGPAAVGPDVLQAAFKRERRLQTEEEDPHMKQYVEDQLAKRVGRATGEQKAEAERARAEELARMQDPLLAALPEGLQKRQQDTELGPSWVAGITEVPLSLDQKLANIEATEAAKRKLLSMVPDDDNDEGGGEGAAAHRSAFPVSFGRQNPKLLAVIADTHARKARLRVLQEEKKKQKMVEFKGW